MIITDIKLNINKNRVLNALNCNKESEAFEEFIKIIDDIERDLENIIEPKIVLEFSNLKDNFGISKLNNCNGAYFALFTIGNKISELSTDYFKNNDYLKGMLFDSIGDDLLFTLCNYSKKIISKEAEQKNINIECVLSPGNDLDITYQKLVLDKTNSKNIININITDGFMLNPVKSSTLIVGIDTNKEYEKKDLKHDCSKCNIITCPWKENNEINIIIQDNDKQITITDKNKNILSILQDNNIYLNSPCGGNGTCGKCKIKVIKGQIPPTKEDLKFFNEKEIENGLRLACKAIPKTDCQINISSDNDEGFIIHTDYKSDQELIVNSNVVTKNIDFNDVNWKEETSYSQVLMKKTNTQSVSFNTLIKLSKYMDNTTLNAVIRNRKEIIDISSNLFGIGIDIGTTTIALNLTDLSNGKTIDMSSILNTQRAYGADVISRIQAADDGKLDILKSLVRKEIITSIDNLCGKNNINEENIYSVVIAGNTTMIHLLLGMEVKSLGQFPFTAVTTQLIEYSYNEIFDDSLPNAEVTILPGISTYVGSDIISGMLYSNLVTSDKPRMLIDVGTNGELVIGSNIKVLGAATAAGPAFEGGNIKCGTGSIPGAIASSKYISGVFENKIIGDKDPIGLCGSSIIDIVAEGIKHEWIDYTGLLKDPYSNEHVTIAQGKENDIILNQADIREVQLAKSAVRSGIECLIEEYGCTKDDIEKVYIAGGFGSNINVENTIMIGMIPEEFKDKIEFIGNSSLGGTIKYMLDKSYKEIVNNIQLNSEDINLSALSTFNDEYIMNMTFENGVLE